MTDKKKIYIASPLGFSESGRMFMQEKLMPALQEAGYEPINPWHLTPEEEIEPVLKLPEGEDKVAKLREMNSKLAANNAKAIKEADGLLAVLDGMDIDSGTAAEVGYAAALKKPIVGYRSDYRLASDNQGSVVNMQVEYFIKQNKGSIETTIEATVAVLKNLV